MLLACELFGRIPKALNVACLRNKQDIVYSNTIIGTPIDLIMFQLESRKWLKVKVNPANNENHIMSTINFHL